MNRLATMAALLVALVFARSAFAAEAHVQYGPRIAVGPKAKLPREAYSPVVIKIKVGDDWQKLIDSHPVGTWFRVLPGTHKNVSIAAKSANRFYGESGAIVDGLDVTQFFLRMGKARSVLLKNLDIRNYATPNQYATIEANPALMIEDCVITNSHAMGARAMKWIKGTKFDGNRQSGFSIPTQIGTLVSDCEISNTNRKLWYSGHDRGEFSAGYSGACKLWQSKGCTVQYCYSHDNEGPGFWDDTENDGIVYAHCRAKNNSGPGFFHEVGYTATVRQCKVEPSTLTNPEWPHDGVLCTDGRLIAYENVISGQHDGIRVRQDDRADAVSSVRHCEIFHNRVTQCDRFASLEQIAGRNSLSSKSNNRWHHNQYSKPTNGTVNFLWGTKYITWSKWRALPQDSGGSFSH